MWNAWLAFDIKEIVCVYIPFLVYIYKYHIYINKLVNFKPSLLCCVWNYDFFCCLLCQYYNYCFFLLFQYILYWYIYFTLGAFKSKLLLYYILSLKWERELLCVAPKSLNMLECISVNVTCVHMNVSNKVIQSIFACLVVHFEFTPFNEVFSCLLSYGYAACTKYKYQKEVGQLKTNIIMIRCLPAWKDV